MSAAARKRISEAMKQRWAQRKGKSATKKAASKRKPMSPAARKKLSALMKARWAQRKKAA
jgi:biopolymer transport protein ExbB/TolQ